MTETERADLAVDLFEQGYNCAQSVLGAYLDLIEIDKMTAMKLAASFGGGMGRLREVCGALTGSFMAAGLLRGYTQPDNDDQKGEHYSLIQKLGLEFEGRYETLLCRDLLELEVKHDQPAPSKRTEAYYAERPCARFIYDAVINLEKALAAD